MIDDVLEVEARGEYTPEDLRKLGAKWLERIAASEKREDDWLKDAAVAETAYLSKRNGDAEGVVPAFNILHSNVETIVPSVYNSTPAPDIRPRHNVSDPVTKLVADMLERVIAAQIDDNRLDSEIESSVQDAFMAGRGVVRVVYDEDTTQRVGYRAISWKCYREGPSTRWSEVPWVAFKHSLSQESLEKFSDPELAGLQKDPAQATGDNSDDVCIWEIWCKDSRKVYFVVADNGKVAKIEDDPYGLPGFFPMPQPVQPITGTGSRTPVCPYAVYKELAEELDKQTKRINAIVSGLKVRGVIAADAEAIEDLANADDNTLVPIANIEGLVAAGGLDKAIMWWPINTAVQVLRELFVQREQTKQTIYEVTGISDIVRGATRANETATAQQIKSEWGGLRIKKMQRLVERQVRDLFVLTAEIVTRLFTPETMQAASGIQLPQEAQALLGHLDHYRINVESDSTIRADASRSKQEMGEFLTGTANFFAAMAPVVQADPQAASPVSEIYNAFAKQFNLGKQAEDALEQFSQIAKQAASGPRPNPEAERVQADVQMRMQIKAAELQMKQAEMQGKMQLDAAKLEIEKQKLALEQSRLAIDAQRFQQEASFRQGDQDELQAVAQGKGMEVQEAIVSAVLPVMQQVIGALIEEIRKGQADMAAIVQQGNAQIVAAMMAPPTAT